MADSDDTSTGVVTNSKEISLQALSAVAFGVVTSLIGNRTGCPDLKFPAQICAGVRNGHSGAVRSLP
jgi:hypothetical protein